MNRTSGGFVDHFTLWASLGASLYLMPFGALLVPELSIGAALAAALLAALLAGLLVAAIVALAARTNRSTLDLLAEPLGDRSRLPLAGLLVLRHTLFATFALVLIADAATLLGERSLGTDLRPFWVLLFAAAALAVSLALGRWPVLRRVGLGLIILLAVAIAASAYMEFEIPSYLRRPAAGGWPEFWQAVSVMLVFPILWLPVAADHARGSPDHRAATLGSLLGLTLMATWFGALGIIYLPATDSGDTPGFLVGMELGLGAMIFLLLLQLDEVFVNAQSFEFVADDLNMPVSRLTSVIPLLVAIPAAIFLHVGDLEGYLLLVGAVFVPAFGVVLAYSLRPIDQPLALPLVAWAGGFVLYQWISPADIGWWLDALNWSTEQLGVAFPLSDEIGWLGAIIPSFLFAFAVQLIACATLTRSAGRSLTPVAG